MSTKKRLALLPEVLPKPQVVAPGQRSVRSRTLARLSALAALGAAGVAASCTSGVSSGGGDGDGGGPFGLPEGGRESGPDAYGVVDPLPPPSCFRNGAPTVSAGYIADAGSSDSGTAPRDVLVDLTFPQTGVVIGTVTASNGVTVRSKSSSTNGGKIALSVPSGVSDSLVQVQTSCSAGPSTLTFDATFDTADVTITNLSY